MSHLTPQQLSGLRTALLQQQEDIKHRLSNSGQYGLQEAMRDNTGELSEIDNHPGDAATELYNRSMDISLLERDEHELDDIESALRAMDEGTYGICIASGEPIPYERLAALPSTRYTKEHAPRQSAPFTRRPRRSCCLRRLAAPVWMSGTTRTGSMARMPGRSWRAGATRIRRLWQKGTTSAPTMIWRSKQTKPRASWSPGRISWPPTFQAII